MDLDASLKLEKVITFLMEDSKWGFSCIDGTVAVKYMRDHSVLELEIKDVLQGQELSHFGFSLIYRHILLEERLNPNAHKNAKKFLQAIRHFGFDKQKLNANEEMWLEAKDKVSVLQTISQVPYDLDMDYDIDIKGDAIRALREWGYEIPLDKGRFGPTKNDEVKFGEAMRYRFDKIGEIAVGVLFDNIHRLYREDTRRYDFRPAPASIGSVCPLTCRRSQCRIIY